MTLPAHIVADPNVPVGWFLTLKPSDWILMPYKKGRSALPTISLARKAIPMVTVVLDYFPAALAEVAKVSRAGNEKHNSGKPLQHSRGLSTDHADSLLRHLVDRGGIDPDTGVRHSAEVAWRALALLQQELEDAGEAPLPRGASLPTDTVDRSSSIPSRGEMHADAADHNRGASEREPMGFGRGTGGD